MSGLVSHFWFLFDLLEGEIRVRNKNAFSFLIILHFPIGWRRSKYEKRKRVFVFRFRRTDWTEEANVTWQTLNGTVGNDNCLFKPILGILSRSLSPSWFSQYRLEGGIIFENKNGFLFFVFALPIGPTSPNILKRGRITSTGGGVFLFLGGKSQNVPPSPPHEMGK